MKLFNRKQEAKMPNISAEPKVETAVVLIMNDNGGRSVGILDVKGIEMLRPATMADLYRMCSEVLSDLDAIKVVDRLRSVTQPRPMPVTPPVQETKPEEPKTEEKIDEPKV